jgi:hypothetical protein
VISSGKGETALLPQKLGILSLTPCPKAEKVSFLAQRLGLALHISAPPYQVVEFHPFLGIPQEPGNLLFSKD